jgi:hypothetical protein
VLERATTWDGYVMDEKGVLAGTIQVRAGRPGKKSHKCKTTVTVRLVGARKQTLSQRGVFDGKINATLPDGRALDLTLGANSLSGTFGEYALDGARNVFKAKDAVSKERAAQALKRWRGTYAAACPGANGWRGLSVKVNARGKIRATGWTGSGARFIASSQLLVGERDCAAAVTANKRGASEASLLWFYEDGSVTCESRPDGVATLVSGVGAGFAPGAAFRIDAAAVAARVPGVRTDLLPDGRAVQARGGENPSGLKLKYRSQIGLFTGRFKVFFQENGRPKKVSAKVIGVVVDGKGYGMAVIGHAGTVAITVE